MDSSAGVIRLKCVADGVMYANYTGYNMVEIQEKIHLRCACLLLR